MIDRLRKIIVVSGKGSSGKTTAIRRAMGKLGIDINSRENSDRLFCGYANSTGSYICVGIASGGDNEWTVNNNIDFLRPHPCPSPLPYLHASQEERLEILLLVFRIDSKSSQLFLKQSQRMMKNSKKGKQSDLVKQSAAKSINSDNF